MRCTYLNCPMLCIHIQLTSSLICYYCIKQTADGIPMVFPNKTTK